MANSTIEAQPTFVQVTIPANRINTNGGSGLWFFSNRTELSDLIPLDAQLISITRGNWTSSQDGIPYFYGNVIGIAFTSAKSSNDVNLMVVYKT